MSEVKLKIYMADEIWAGREYNPKEIPMEMQFVTKEDYDKLLTRTPEAQSPEAKIAEGLKSFMVNNYAGQFVPKLTSTIMDKITNYYPDVKFGEDDVNEILCVLNYICESDKEK